MFQDDDVGRFRIKVAGVVKIGQRTDQVTARSFRRRLQCSNTEMSSKWCIFPNDITDHYSEIPAKYIITPQVSQATSNFHRFFAKSRPMTSTPSI